MAYAGLIAITLVLDARAASPPSRRCCRRHAGAGAGSGAGGGGRGAAPPQSQKQRSEELRENVRRAARRAAQDAWGKKPVTRVYVWLEAYDRQSSIT